jgi:hypothetical protein
MRALAFALKAGRTMSRNGYLPLIVAGIVFSTPAIAACKLGDIKILQADWHRQMGSYVRVVGEIVNMCSEPVGVQLQLIFRDDKRKVVNVEEFWPASTRNIAPNASYPISYLVFMESMTGRPKTMEARVIEVRRW